MPRRFSLKLLLVAVTLIACGLAYRAAKVRAHNRAVAYLQARGFRLVQYYEWDIGLQPPIISRVLGVNCYSVMLDSTSELDDPDELKIADCEALVALVGLREVDIHSSRFDLDDAIEISNFRPNCKVTISHDTPSGVRMYEASP